MSTVRQKPELLAPAGDRLCITAAVENGADAVYFGLECGFNARARATNLHIETLPEVMAFLHERGVRGFVTLNTLVFPSELPTVERTIVQLTEADVDALLVQDLGLVRVVRAISPDLSIHASTQMTLTSAECIRMAQHLGIERVVLPRELSIDEIRAIHEHTDIELEAFVHGALCVAYSGQCLTSESLGGRSANRGQCAQACRLPYDLVCDGKDVDLGLQKYLLSPQDLAAYALVPELIDAGVSCLKIEGRLKTPEYVANITSHYRRAIDAAVARRPLDFTERDITEMELSFSRGFSPGWLRGNDHKMLVPAASSAKRGVLLGKIVQVRGQRVVIDAGKDVAAGDGIVFEGDREHGQEQGGRVYEAAKRGKLVELAFGRGAIDFGKLYPGQQIWKTDDPQLTSRLRKSYTGNKPLRRVPLDIHVEATVNSRLRLSGKAANGGTFTIESDEPLAPATKHPLTQETLKEQLSRLGHTVYELRKITANITGGPMVPLSVLGKLRQRLIAGLEVSLGTQNRRSVRTKGDAGLIEPAREASAELDAPRLHVLCRTLEQIEAAAGSGIDVIYADFCDIRKYREAVEVAHSHGARIYLATPRIQKPGEMGIFRAIAKHGADGWLVRNLAGVGFCRQENIPFVADFSLNAANQYTVDYLQSLGSERVTVSYDLNRDQLLDLVNAVTPQWLEVVVHQHMPMFHMEHCVFCAVLSPGTNKHNCGRPCDVHEVKLRDRIGMEHALQADVGCRNTLYNAVPQSAAEAVSQLLQRGLRALRVELLTESACDVRRLIVLYQNLLAGRVSGKHVWQELQASNRVGVTRGTLEERRNPLAIL